MLSRNALRDISGLVRLSPRGARYGARPGAVRGRGSDEGGASDLPTDRRGAGKMAIDGRRDAAGTGHGGRRHFLGEGTYDDAILTGVERREPGA